MKYVLFILSLFMTLNCIGQSLSPTRDVEATDDGIIVTYRFHGGFHQDDPLHPGAKFWKIPGFALNDVAGEPCFPFHWDTFAVPDDCEACVTLIDSAYTDTLFTLAPAYPPLWDSDTIGYIRERVPEISPYAGRLPHCTVKQDKIQYYRGQGLVRVATLPIQYNMQTHTVRSFSLLRYKISFTQEGSPVRGQNYVSARNDNRISLSDPFLENITLNYSLSQNGRKNIMRRTRSQNNNEPDAVADNRDYLIISTPSYSVAANKFAEWKRTKGFRTHVVLQDSLTVKSVKTKILELYNADGVNLYDILFIGRRGVVPSYANSHSPENSIYHPTDYYYGCIEDTINTNETIDTYPSIRRGRLLVQTEDEANVVVNKIISYEKSPYLGTNFYQNAVHCAYFQDWDKNNVEDRRFVLTSEEIKNCVEYNGKTIGRIYITGNDIYPSRWNNDIYSNGDSIPHELQRPNFEWHGTSQDIVDKINQGAFHVLYRGHGDWNFWDNPFFSVNFINRLTNDSIQPIVFSICCKSGRYSSSNCFAEKFLKKRNGGCVSIIAASEISYSGYNDSFTEGMFNAIWPTPGLTYHFPAESGSAPSSIDIPVYDMGSIMDYGFFYLSNFGELSNDSIVNQYIFFTREVFNLFGDPSMMMYTEQPLEISSPSIFVKGDTIKVRTTNGEARISFYTPDSTQRVDSYIGSSVDYSTTADSIIICIDRHNCIPYVVTYHRNEFIQNEHITDSRFYVGKHIKTGRNVTSTKPEGDVIIDGANIIINGGNVEFHPGTTIINSNVQINPAANHPSQ